MADELQNIKISELPEVEAVSPTIDFIPIARESEVYDTGSASYKVTPKQIFDANVVVNSPERATQSLATIKIGDTCYKVSSGGMDATNLNIKYVDCVITAEQSRGVSLMASMPPGEEEPSEEVSEEESVEESDIAPEPTPNDTEDQR